MRSLHSILGVALLALALAPDASLAGGTVSVGSGTSMDLGSTTFDLACADLTVTGSFATGTGTLDRARHLSIAPGGSLLGETGTLNVAGDWDNASGGFTAGTSSVNLVDGCGVATATVSGTNTFSTLTISTSTPKTVRLPTGVTQTVSFALSLQGALGNLLSLRSTSSGVSASIDAMGSLDADFVDIADLDFSASPLFLGPHSVVGTNATAITLCGDIDGGSGVDATDLAQARSHLMGRAIAGDIRFCNVIGPPDPLDMGEDCDVADVAVLARVVAGEFATEAEATCDP